MNRTRKKQLKKVYEVELLKTRAIKISRRIKKLIIMSVQDGLKAIGIIFQDGVYEEVSSHLGGLRSKRTCKCGSTDTHYCPGPESITWALIPSEKPVCKRFRPRQIRDPNILSDFVLKSRDM